MRRVQSPDGREWEVRDSRFRLPVWRQNDFDPWDHTVGVLDAVVAFVILLPIFVVIVPLAVFAAELPVSLARGLFGSHGWVEAVSWYPQTMRITWRVDDRRNLASVYERIVEHLSQGYDGLRFEGVRIVDMTPPAGLADLSA
jgi:hypothetical protein